MLHYTMTNQTRYTTRVVETYLFGNTRVPKRKKTHLNSIMRGHRCAIWQSQHLAWYTDARSEINDLCALGMWLKIQMIRY